MDFYYISILIITDYITYETHLTHPQTIRTYVNRTLVNRITPTLSYLLLVGFLGDKGK